MSQVGGPAAINGFLYQIVHHISWLSEVSLSGTLEGEVVRDALLVLEPSTGGDSRAEGSDIYLVEQYKTRQGGTWSVTDVEKVLTNLRKAVPSSLPLRARYRFVTDGGPGRLDGLRLFLNSVKSVSTAEDLSDAEKREFAPGQFLSDRKYFEHIAVASRSASSEEKREADEHSILLHLLSRLELEFGSNSIVQSQKIEGLLRRYAPDLGSEGKIREHLVGIIFEMLSHGETQLDIAAIGEIFRRAGLSVDRLRTLASLGTRLRELTQCRLARLKYDSSQDVRSSPTWPAEKSVLVIAGASGVGKTWQLGRLMADLPDEQLATLVASGTTTEEVVNRAARDVWQLGLRETSTKSLAALSIFLSELNSVLRESLLIVALDDIQDIDFARNLIREDWQELRMRLVLTTSPNIASALQLSDGEVIHVHTVEGFTTDELATLLEKCGRRWSDLSPDLKRLLRNPILASLYLGLPYASIARVPRSEYEIFEGFWRRIAEKGRLGDEGIVIALAARVLEKKSYPLSRPKWREIGLESEEAAARLESVGWLRNAEGGEIAFAHDRLLCWACAKHLQRQFRRGRESVDLVGGLLSGATNESMEPLQGRLGYVPMDTLWLLSEDEADAQELCHIVSRIEAGREFGTSGEHLYLDHLPTLGGRAIPILVGRLASLPEDDAGSYQAALVGKSLSALSIQEGVDLREVVWQLIHSTSRNEQMVAIAVLAVRPDVRLLDRLWQIHTQRLETLPDRNQRSRFSEYEASFAALKNGIALDPLWLKNRIITADPERDRVAELGFLMNAVEHREMQQIWIDVADIFVSKTAFDKPRSLLYCIARFKDRGRMATLVQHLSSPDDFSGGAALAALASIDPQAALKHLTDVDNSLRDLFRGQWLPILLRAEPDLTRARILELAKADPKGRRLVEEIFEGRPDEMNVALFDFVLTSLERDLAANLKSNIEGDPHWLYGSLRVLVSVLHPPLLALLRSRAGGPLEDMITTVACSRLCRVDRHQDLVLEYSQRMLALIGGNGLCELIVCELNSEQYWVRHIGLRWAMTREDPRVVECLARVSSRAVPREKSGDPESDPYMEYHSSISALAGVGPDSLLIAALQSSGVSQIPSTLALLRCHRPPIAKEALADALTLLDSVEVAEEKKLIALATLWLSDNSEVIPAVRGILANASPEGLIARYACIALQALNDRSPDFLALAERMLSTAANSHWAVNALLCLEEEGLDSLARWLAHSARQRRAVDEERAIRALYMDSSRRKLAIGAALKLALYDIAAEANEPALREQILDKAFSNRRQLANETLLAIEGVAKFDTARAIDAVEFALQSSNSADHSLCMLLVRVAPEAAPAVLIRCAVSSNRESLTRAVGRSLRLLDVCAILELLREHAKGSDHQRKIVADLAAWLPDPRVGGFLQQLFELDGALVVRHAALSALANHSKLSNLLALLESLQMADIGTNTKWSLLVAIVESGDPYLLTEEKDVLCLGRSISSAPYAFAHHAEYILHNRKRREK
jgi:hypothetical protein